MEWTQNIYDVLRYKIPKKELTQSQVSKVRKFLERNKDDKEIQKVLFALIRIHSHYSKDEEGDIPFGGTREGNILSWNFASLPRSLKQILFKFVVSKVG